MSTPSVCATQLQLLPGIRAHAVVANLGGVISADVAIPRAKPRRLWSDAEADSLRQRYVTSEPVRCLAEDLDRSTGSVYAKARRLQLRRPKTAVSSVLTSPVLCPSTIVVSSLAPSEPRQRVRSHINGVRQVWFDDVNERTERLWIAGFHPETIASVLGPGFTSASVSTKAHRLGYPRRPEWRSLSRDLEAARRVDHEATPLCGTMRDLEGGVRVRRRCPATGNVFYAERGQRYSPQAKETKSWKASSISL